MTGIPPYCWGLRVILPKPAVLTARYALSSSLAEEMINGGEIMVKEGLFDRFPCDVIFGMHNMPGLPVGKFFFQPGALMASMDQFHITVRGCGGHGAIPHKAIDPVLVAAHITTALQSIVSRNVDPLEAAVITVGSIVAGEAANVIPDSAEMKISVRSLSRDTRQLLLTRIPALAQARLPALALRLRLRMLTVHRY